MSLSTDEFRLTFPGTIFTRDSSEEILVKGNDTKDGSDVFYTRPLLDKDAVLEEMYVYGRTYYVLEAEDASLAMDRLCRAHDAIEKTFYALRLDCMVSSETGKLLDVLVKIHSRIDAENHGRLLGSVLGALVPIVDTVAKKDGRAFDDVWAELLAEAEIAKQNMEVQTDEDSHS